MRGARLTALILLLFTVTFCMSAFAQSERGAITGTVVDSTGAVVPNAQVTAVNQGTGETRKATTSSEGKYLLPELKPAPWKVKVEAPGFKVVESEIIQVPVQTTRTLNVTLQVASATSTVEVTAAAQVIQTENSVLQTNVSERQVKEMPLMVQAEIGGRTPLAFIFLDSNVTSSDFNSKQNATSFRVNGGQALGAEILIDGANTRRAQNGSFFSEVAPGPNAFQEFTYNTTSYSSEYGNSSAGVVSFALKSGTNGLHGEVYEHFRNEALNANSWINNYEKTRKGRDRQNDFGFNLGGPVYIPKVYDGRNKTFFFFNYNGYRFNMSENKYITVPTRKMRTGDFSDLLTDAYVLQQLGGPIAIYDPRLDPVNRTTPIPGNRLDLYQNGAALDPVGMKILNYFPEPTRDGVFNNYLASTSAPVNMDSEVIKIDQTLTEKQKITLSYSYRNQTAIKGGFPRMPYPAISAGVWDQVFKSHYGRLQHDYTLTNSILNHFNIGWNRVYVANSNSTAGFDTLSLGLPPQATANLTFPMIEFPGYDAAIDARAAQGIGSTWWHDTMGDNMVEISDSLSWVKGKHTLKFGGDVRIQQLNMFQNFDNGGHFNFRHEQTAGLNGTGGVVGGWPLASLATGATEWSWVTVTGAKPAYRFLNHAYFINDDFKVTSRLTLNLGLRYELQMPRTEAHDWYRAFDPTAMNPVVNRPGALVSAGNGGVPSKYRGMYETDKTNLAPRVGFAYALDSKTAVRGGMGVYYSPFLYGAGGGMKGYRAGRNIIPRYELGQYGFMVSREYLRTYPNRPDITPTGQYIGDDVEYFQPDAKAGRTVQWTLDMQRELPGNFVVTAAYIGNKGTRLRTNMSRMNALPLNALKLGNPILTKNVNDLTAADRAYAASVGVTLPANGDAVYTGFNGSVAQALKPFPQYNRINNELETRGQSWYNALNLKAERRFSNGLQFGASYTWSKLITNAGDDLWGATPLTGVMQNPFDTKSMRSLSPTNAAHVFVFSYIYELPFGKGKAFLNNNSVLDKIVGGWQINGIHRYQGGIPLTISFNGGAYRDFLEMAGYFGNLRPNLTGQPILTDAEVEGYRVQLINRDAFSLPARYSAPPTTNVADPAYAAYYADPTRFFGTGPAVHNARVLPYYSENFSILKKIAVREGMKAEIGAEFFNIFNRHRYWMPDTNLDAGGFGQSTVQSDPRVIQLRARFVF